MNKNISTIIYSAVASVALIFLGTKLVTLFQCSSSMYSGSCYTLGFINAFKYYIGIPISVVIIPLVSGILGFILSRETRLKQALYTFLISLLVTGVIILPGHFRTQAQEKEKARAECERQRQGDIERIRILQETDPGSIKNLYVPPPCQ